MPHKPSAWEDIVNADDLKLANELIVKHFENPEIPYDQTIRYRHRNGSTVWIRCRGLAIRNKEGKPVRLLGSHQDVTEYIVNKSKLDKTFALLNYTQKIAAIGSWELDLRTNEVFWTEELYNMYGFDAKIPPPPYTEHMKLFTPESWEQLSSALNLTREKGIPYEMELNTIRKDGNRGYMWVYGEARFDEKGDITHIKGIAQDITERKIAEEKLRINEERWQFVIEGSGDGTWDWNPQEKKAFYSNRWLEMLGYKPEEFTDNDNEWSSRIHPDDIAFTFAEISQNLSGETESFNFEYRFRNKEGKYLWILNRGKVVERNANGDAIRVVGSHSNISKLKQTEELIKVNEMRLSLAVKAGGIGIWDWDIVSDKLTWDDQMFTMA
jgi:PAS domain S-box-containing protein